MTRSTFESHAVLRSVSQELDPHSFKAAVYAHLRGGYPGSSMSDGRGASEPALPGSGTNAATGRDKDPGDLALFDRTDAELLAIRDDYDRRISALADLALELRTLQRQLLWRRPLAPVTKPQVYALLGAEGPDPEPMKWCVSCMRAKVNGHPHLVPVADPKKGGKNCELCRNCLDHSRINEGRWPPLEWCVAWAEGRRVLVKAKP